jgi:hypothetical protein
VPERSVKPRDPFFINGRDSGAAAHLLFANLARGLRAHLRDTLALYLSFLFGLLACFVSGLLSRPSVLTRLSCGLCCRGLGKAEARLITIGEFDARRFKRSGSGE